MVWCGRAVLARFDAIVRFDRQRAAYGAQPMGTLEKGSVTGALAFGDLRRHLPDPLAQPGSQTRARPAPRCWRADIAKREPGGRPRREAMRFAGWYGALVAVLMLSQWGVFLAAGAVPQLQTAPREIGFHLAAELVTALGLLASGVALLTNRPWGLRAYLLSAGMLVYTVINSSGYFAQREQWGFVGMFGVLLLLAIVSVAALLRSPFHLAETSTGRTRLD